MQIEFITKKDLEVLKTEMLDEIRTMLVKNKPANSQQKEWLKSYEVRKLLGISPGTLQNMRINGTLNYTKIGGILFYSYADIQQLLQANKTNFSGR